MHEWSTLVTRMGTYISSPSPAQLKDALEEVFASQDLEHPDAWIECGSDNGPLFTISVFSSGYAIYTKYSDVDMTDELETKQFDDLDLEGALDVWLNLINGSTTHS